MESLTDDKMEMADYFKHGGHCLRWSERLISDKRNDDSVHLKYFKDKSRKCVRHQALCQHREYPAEKTAWKFKVKESTKIPSRYTPPWDLEFGTCRAEILIKVLKVYFYIRLKVIFGDEIAKLYDQFPEWELEYRNDPTCFNSLYGYIDKCTKPEVDDKPSEPKKKKENTENTDDTAKPNESPEVNSHKKIAYSVILDKVDETLLFYKSLDIKQMRKTLVKLNGLLRFFYITQNDNCQALYPEDCKSNINRTLNLYLNLYEVSKQPIDAKFECKEGESIFNHPEYPLLSAPTLTYPVKLMYKEVDTFYKKPSYLGILSDGNDLKHMHFKKEDSSEVEKISCEIRRYCNYLYCLQNCKYGFNMPIDAYKGLSLELNTFNNIKTSMYQKYEIYSDNVNHMKTFYVLDKMFTQLNIIMSIAFRTKAWEDSLSNSENLIEQHFFPVIIHALQMCSEEWFKLLNFNFNKLFF
jgi:hypothetical protein